MSRRNFAKKFVAYSMAFAVAFSTITVSPVFVREAKAAGAISISDGADAVVEVSASPTTIPGKFFKPADGSTTKYNGAVIVGPVYSKIASANKEMTLEDFNALVGLANMNIAGSISNTNVVTLKEGAEANAVVHSVGVAFNGKDRDTEDTKYGNLNVKYEAKDGLKPSPNNVKGCDWYKLSPRTKIFEYSENGTTEKITVPYYVLLKVTNTTTTNNDVLTFPEVNADQTGVYVGIKNDKVADTLVLKEVSDMDAKASQKTVTSVVGKKVTLGIDATATRNITYSWTRNGKELGTDATLVVDLATKNDFGTYNCKVSDGIEEQTIPVSIVETKDTTAIAGIKSVATGINTYKNVLDTVTNKNLYVKSGTLNTTPKFIASASDVEGYEQVFTASSTTEETLVSGATGNMNVTGTTSGDQAVKAYTEKGTLKYTLKQQALTLPSDEFVLTTSIPENNEFVYIWNSNATSLMSNSSKVNYDASNRGLSLNREKFGSTLNSSYGVTVYAVSKSQYEKVLEKQIKAVKEAEAYDKVTKVNTLISDAQAEIGNKLTALFTETITLQSDAKKDVSEVKVATLGDSIKLTAPTFTGVDKNTKYKWTGANTTNIATTDKNVLNVNTLGIEDFGTYTCTVDVKGNSPGTTSDDVIYKVNVVYVSDFTASATEVVSAKIGAKNVTFEVDAKSTLPITYTWKYMGTSTSDPNSGTSPLTAKNTYVIPEITDSNATGVFAEFKVDGTLNQAKPFYTCEVSDGIASKTFYFAVKKSVGFTVEGLAKEELSARENTDVTLAPVVKLDESKAVTYSWTKKGSTNVLSTEPTYTFAFDGKSVHNYVVTITDGVQKETKEYEVSKFTTVDTDLNNYEVIFDDSVVYNGKEQTGNLVVRYKGRAAASGVTALPAFILVNGTDYTVEYAENVNVGVARFTVKFIGDFKDVKNGSKTTLTDKFFIDRADNEVKLADVTANVGGNVKPVATDLADAPMTIKFYADKALTKEVTEAAVKAKAGTYYAQASAIATANYNAAKSNVATIVVKGLGTTSSLAVTARTSTTMTVKFAKVANAAGYRIYVKNVKTNYAWKLVKETTALTYKVTGLPAGYNTAVAVRAYDANKVLAPKYASVTKRTAPGTTSKVTITTSKNAAKLTWSKVTGATHYRVYVKKAGKWTAIANTNKNTFTKTGLKRRTTYTFAVKAYNSTDKLWADKYVAKSAKTK